MTAEYEQQLLPAPFEHVLLLCKHWGALCTQLQHTWFA